MSADVKVPEMFTSPVCEIWRSHLIPHAISALEEQLDPTIFVRIHRTRIVNVHHIDSVRAAGGSYTVVMRDGGAHSVSRSRKEVLMRLLPDGP
jgi:two-component system LytT family response regulator